MTLGEFLSDRFQKIMMLIVFMLTAAVFLTAVGTSSGVVAIVLIAAFLTAGLIQISDFLKCRARMEELWAVMNGLNEKYLFAECVPQADSAYERKLFELLGRSEKAMIEAVSNAQVSQREYREYVESWVHEMKTPVTAAKLICRNTGGEAQERLLRELCLMEAHIERALFYARAESPEKDYVIRQCGLNEIVGDAIKNHQTLLIQNGVRIEVEELNYQVYTDDKWASFIIGQLLQNSARYHGTEPVITLTARSLGKQVQLLVSDNGIGIPMHELPRVFDRGFTGRNGRKRGGSTGMGLYLCSKLAGFLQIDIKIESEERGGATVSLIFPAKENLTKM